MYYSRLFHSCLFSIVSIFSITCQPVKQEDTSPTVLLKKDVFFFAHDSLKGRDTGSEGERQAAKYIVDRFRAAGLVPWGTQGYYQFFKKEAPLNHHEVVKKDDKKKSIPIKSSNIIGMIDNSREDIIVVGAHYDHIGYGGISSLDQGDKSVHNGADDNASGVAVMIQLAEKLKQKKLPQDILFIAFSGEEKGLWGSNYFCKHPTVKWSRIKAMINMDMIGRLDEQKGMVIYGMDTSPSWEDIVQKANTDSLKLLFKSSGAGPSDHTSFYLKNIPVLHFFTGQHEDYHKPGDDAEKLNYEGMVKISNMIERVVIETIAKKKMVFTKTKDEALGIPHFSVVLGIVPDYLFDGKGLRIDGVSEGKAAQRAGIQKGDIIIALGSSEVTNITSYMKALSTFKKDDKTQIKIMREGISIILPVVF